MNPLKRGPEGRIIDAGELAQIPFRDPAIPLLRVNPIAGFKPVGKVEIPGRSRWGFDLQLDFGEAVLRGEVFRATSSTSFTNSFSYSTHFFADFSVNLRKSNVFNKTLLPGQKLNFGRRGAIPVGCRLVALQKPVFCVPLAPDFSPMAVSEQ